MNDQDAVTRRQRLMLDGKRGSKLVSDYSEVENISSITYNLDNTISQIVLQRVSADGTTWEKTINFGYTSGNLTSKTETLEVLVPVPDEGI